MRNWPLRQRESECRTLTDRTFHPDLPAMQLKKLSLPKLTQIQFLPSYEHSPLTIYPNRLEKPRFFQFFDKRIVKKFSCFGILGLGKLFLIEIT
jgi:hypothetical protein